MKRYAKLCLTFMTCLIFLGLITPLQAANELKMLVWEGYAPADQAKRFEAMILKKYKKKVTLKIEFISDPNDFFDAIRKKKADLISPTHNLIKDQRFGFIKKKLLLPIDLKKMTHYKNIIKALQKADYATENGKVYAMPFVHGPYGLGFNSKVLNAPGSWNILWDSKFAKKYTVSSDYYEVNIYITALAMGLRGSQISDYQALNTPEFKSKLRELTKNAKSLWEGVDKADDLQGLSLAAVWGFSFPELAKRGENWKIADPKEGTMGWVDNYAMGWSLNDKPFLKKVAEEWLNFIISPNFQVHGVVRGLGSAPVNLSIKNKLTKEEVKTHHMNDPNYFQDNRIPWPTINNKRDRNGMKRLWDDAMKGI